MRAFHTLRTKNRKDFKIADFEIFIMILSALEWKNYNGKIFLYTDKIGAKFIYDARILEILDGVNISLNELDTLQIDLNFIFWQPLNVDRFKNELAVIHRENKNVLCYPDKNFFRFKNNFALPQNLNWDLEPCNAVFVYLGDKKFVEAYSKIAFEFMKTAAPTADKKGWDLLPYMVFIEQRWLAMCAEICGVKIHSLATLQELFDGGQNFIWIFLVSMAIC